MARRTTTPQARGPVRSLTDFRPLAQGRNPNLHTSQGLGQLDAAMDRHGYVAPMTASADGVVLDGNARLEKVATKFPDVAPLVVEHDGTRPVIMVRTDIKDANDPLALDIIVSANRVAEVDLLYDSAVLRAFEAEGLNLSPFEFDARTLTLDTPPPTSFPVVDESINTEHQCPKCGYQWSGGKAVAPIETGDIV